MPPRRLSAAALAVSALAAAAHADDRKYVWSDEARVTPKGMVEFEQWVTWETYNKDDKSDFNRFNFKEELEIGVHDNLQIGVEIPAWHIQTGPKEEKDGPRLDAFAADVRYIIIDPVKEGWGLAVKPEIGISGDEFDLEGRVIVQKNIDQVELVYNLTVEAGWVTEDGHRYHEREGEISQTFGADFEFAPKWFVGAEALWEIPLPDWHTGRENQNFFIGPNLSSHHTNWAVTVAPLIRVTDSDEEPRFLVRAVVEVDF